MQSEILNLHENLFEPIVNVKLSMLKIYIIVTIMKHYHIITKPPR